MSVLSTVSSGVNATCLGLSFTLAERLEAIAPKRIVPVNPFSLWSVIVEVRLSPASSVPDVGVDEIVKSEMLSFADEKAVWFKVSLTDNANVNEPAVGYAWLAVAPLAIPPSPKFQL